MLIFINTMTLCFTFTVVLLDFQRSVG